MRKIKIKAEIEFEATVYDVIITELKNKTDIELANYILKNIGCRLYERWNLSEDGFIDLQNGIIDPALDPEEILGNIEIITYSAEEILDKKFINSLKK